MATLFKDYGKDNKDFLTKNFSAAGKWTVESKQKAPKGGIIVNPTATNDGKFSADIEGTTACGATVKITATPDDLRNCKATIGYTHQIHKFETVVSRKAGSPVAVEVSHSTGKLLNGRLAVNEKVSRDSVEIGLGLAALAGLSVGCDAVYTLKTKDCNWNLGCVAKPSCGVIVSARTNRLATATIGVVAPLKVCDKLKPRLAGQVDVNVKARTWKGVAAVELACPRLPGNVIKARLDKGLEWAVSYVAKLPGQWTVAVSLDRNLKTGVVFTCN